MIKVKLKEGIELPKYATELAAGFDLSANSIINVFKGSVPVSSEKLLRIQESFRERGYIKIRGFERILFGTGVSVELPPNYELQLRPRSGLALKKGLTLLNAPGTIDADYRGEIGAIIYNSNQYLATVDKGERICQGVIHTVERPEFQIVEELSETDRGAGGFGSTGEQ